MSSELRAYPEALRAAVEPRGQRIGPKAARVAVRPAATRPALGNAPAPAGSGAGMCARGSVAQQIRHRIDRSTEVANFEVQVRAGRMPGGADIADRLTAADALTHR